MEVDVTYGYLGINEILVEWLQDSNESTDPHMVIFPLLNTVVVGI